MIYIYYVLLRGILWKFSLLLDGSDEASLIALKASSDLDLAADLLATAEEGGDLEEAEKRIEDALEALLDAEIEGNQEEDDSVRRLIPWMYY